MARLPGFIAGLEHLNWLPRHDRRDSMLIDKLGMPVAAQKNTELSNQVTTPCSFTPLTRKM